MSGGAAADVEAVVGSFRCFADLQLIFIDDITVGLGTALFVVYIPAEGLEHRVDEVDSELCFAVSFADVGVEVLVELLNLLYNFRRARNPRLARWRGRRRVGCVGFGSLPFALPCHGPV